MQAPETSEATNARPASYDADFYAWTQEQVALLRGRQWSQVDLLNVIEEIESLGKQQRRELRNRLSILIGHLLKWHYQPQNRSRSWLATLRIQRLDIADLLEDSPSLKPYLDEVLSMAYQKGIQLAVKETELPDNAFPSVCPYRMSDILDNDFYPGTEHR